MRYQELLIQENDIVIVDQQSIYKITEPTSAVGTALQPLLLIVNTLAIVATITR